MPTSLAPLALTGWDFVIADAKRHIQRLQAALGHAEAMKKSGEPFPGEFSTPLAPAAINGKPERTK